MFENVTPGTGPSAGPTQPLNPEVDSSNPKPYIATPTSLFVKAAGKDLEFLRPQVPKS